MSEKGPRMRQLVLCIVLVLPSLQFVMGCLPMLNQIFQSDQKWQHLRTTFGPIPGLGEAYAAQPRTLAELTDEGWVQISSCADNNPKYILSKQS